MARRDVIHYYYDIQNSYLELVNTIKELESAHKTGDISDERYHDLFDRLESEIVRQKEVYESISYIIFLLNIPVRVKKGKKYKKDNEVYFNFLKKYSAEEKIDENSEGLKIIKQLIKEELEKKNG